MTGPEVVRQMWRTFSALGAHERHALDTSGQSADETLSAVQAGLSRGAFRLD
jgi:hypothetical protein